MREITLMSTEPRKFIHFIHSPFTLEHAGVKVEVNENGKIKFSKDNPDGTFDEIEFPESLINRVSRMLYTTRKKVWKDYPFKEEE